jgi:AAA domain
MTVNHDVVTRSEEAAGAAITDFVARAGEEAGVVLTSVAGAGKSTFVGRAAGVARKKGMRVAVCAPTNEQAFGLVEKIARMNPGELVTFVPAKDVNLPVHIAAMPNVSEVRPAGRANHSELIVGTFDKFADALARGDLGRRDALLADESYQADSARYFGVAGIAPTHLLVGDGGQIDPFSTVAAAERWRGLEEDPLQTAVAILRRNHPETPVHFFPITRRLDLRAVPVARAFYPSAYRFDAAVLPGVRQLTLQSAIAGSRHLRLLDHALNLAAADGWAHLELPDTAALLADPETAGVIVELVQRLLHRGPQLRCEQERSWQPLRPSRVAVGVSHNDQKDLMRIALDEAGLDAVLVDTANKLQGLEFDVVVCWHPLAGLPDPDVFHLAPGRLCVLLTRHRHACILVGRAGDRELLAGIPPATPAYLGADDDPMLDGWGVHQAVFTALEPCRIAL